MTYGQFDGITLPVESTCWTVWICRSILRHSKPPTTSESNEETLFNSHNWKSSRVESIPKTPSRRGLQRPCRSAVFAKDRTNRWIPSSGFPPVDTLQWMGQTRQAIGDRRESFGTNHTRSSMPAVNLIWAKCSIVWTAFRLDGFSLHSLRTLLRERINSAGFRRRSLEWGASKSYDDEVTNEKLRI